MSYIVFFFINSIKILMNYCLAKSFYIIMGFYTYFGFCCNCSQKFFTFFNLIYADWYDEMPSYPDPGSIMMRPEENRIIIKLHSADLSSIMKHLQHRLICRQYCIMFLLEQVLIFRQKLFASLQKSKTLLQ